MVQVLDAVAISCMLILQPGPCWGGCYPASAPAQASTVALVTRFGHGTALLGALTASCFCPAGTLKLWHDVGLERLRRHLVLDPTTDDMPQWLQVEVPQIVQELMMLPVSLLHCSSAWHILDNGMCWRLRPLLRSTCQATGWKDVLQLPLGCLPEQLQT